MSFNYHLLLSLRNKLVKKVVNAIFIFFGLQHPQFLGKIEWQTRMNVRGPNETAVSKSEGDFSIDLAFSKELFKDKATLTLNIRDLLDQRGWRNETFNENFYNDFEFRWSQRSATLNLTYRFNQKKNQNRRQMRRGGFEGGGFDF